MATGERIGRPAALPAPPLLLPLAAISVSLGAALLVLVVTPADLLGYDYAAYMAAARRLVEGLPLYDPAVDVAGGFAIYLYPPPFALVMVPFLAVPSAAGPWLWAGLLYTAFLIGCLAMPVGPTARWMTVLAMGASWPVVYSLKLGQVGPLLVLTLALGWRWLDRPILLAGSIAAGTLVKLQPAALLGWAVVTRRWRAVLVTVALLALAGLAVTPLFGPGAWFDYIALLSRVNQPVTTPHNFTPGAVIHGLGGPEGFATAAQAVSTFGVIVITAWTWFRRGPIVGYLTTVVAGQLVSPLLWDHYAAVLALPVAFLLQRRRWWVLAIPIALSLPLLFIVPPIVYPIAFWAALIGVALEREGPNDKR
jgi:hypothetical protein